MPTIDERIVEMQFDNKDFEKNVGQSIKSLDALKKSLQFEDSYDGLDKFAKSINKVDLSGIKDSIDDIGKHFTVVGRFIDRHIDGIIRSVETKLTGLFKSISVDQISQGFGKYETQTKAVQTITNATGKSVEEVEGVLSKLMKYTDETSYDFVEMANSIGKFTSVGVELATAEKAMEGIANEAALSGAGKAEANRAMYNFAQALSAGKVQLIDWKSIENANMATKEFKEELIKTAIEYGTIKKTSETAGKIISGSGKKAKETAVNYKTFNQTLSDGWLTSEVLIKTLEKYSEKDGPVGSLGRRAYEAAQKALTFNDAIEAIKDAVSSKWMQSFKYMFGDLDEAIELWTNFCNAVIEVTDAIGEWRNDLLKGWHELGGYNAMIEAAGNAWSAFTSILGAAHDAFANIIPPMTSEKLVEITEHIRDVTAGWKEMFGYVAEQDEEVRRSEEEYDTLAKKIEKVSGEKIIGDRGESVKEIQDILVSLGYMDEKFADGVFGKETQKAVKELKSELGIVEKGSGISIDTWDKALTDALLMGDALKEVDKNVETVTRKIGDMVTTEEEYTEVVNYANKLNTMLEKGRKNNQVKFLQENLIRLGYLDEGQADGIYGSKTEAAVKRLQKALGVEVTGAWDKATWRAARYSKAFEVTETRVRTIEQTVGAQSSTMEKLQNVMRGVAAATNLIGDAFGFVGDVFGVVLKILSPVGSAILTIASAVSTCIVSFNNFVNENKIFETALASIETFLTPVSDALSKLNESVTKFFTDHADITTFTQLFLTLNETFKNSEIGKKLDEWKQKADGFLKSIGIDIGGTIKTVKEFTNQFRKSASNAGLWGKKLYIKSIESFTKFWNMLGKALSDSKNNLLKTVGKFMITIEKAVKKVIPKIKTFSKSIQTFFSGNFKKVITWIQETLPKVIDSVKTFGATIGSVFIKALGGAFGSLISLGAKAFEWANEQLPKAIERIKEFGERVKTAISGKVKSAFEWLAARGPGIVNTAKEIGAAITNFFGFGKDKTSDEAPKTLKDRFEKIKETIGGFVDKIKGKLKEFYNNSPFLQNAWAIISPIFENIKTFFAEIDVEKIKSFFGTLKDSIAKFFDKDTSRESDPLEKLKTRFTELTPVIESFNGIITQIKNAWNNAMGLKDTLEGEEGIETTFVSFWDKIKAFFVSIYKNRNKLIIPAIGALATYVLVSTFRSIKNISAGFKGITDALFLKYGGKKDTAGDTALKIAGAVAILAGAIGLLSLIDFNKGMKGIELLGIAIGALVGAIYGIPSLITKVGGVTDPGEQVKNLAIGLGLIVLSLAGLIAIIAFTPLPVLAGALGLLSGIILGLAGIEILITKKTNGMMKGTGLKGIVQLAIGLGIVVAAFAGMVAVVKKNSIGDLLLAFGGIEIMLATLGYIEVQLTKASKGGAVKVSGILGMAAGLYIIVMAFRKVSDAVASNKDAADKAFVMIEAMLGSIGGLVVLINKTSTGATQSIANAAMIVAMGWSLSEVATTFADALVLVKDVDTAVMITFFAGVDTAFAVLAGIVATFGKMDVKTLVVGELGFVGLMAALSAGIAMLADVGSDAIAKFSTAMWIVGSKLGDFDSMVPQDTSKIKTACDILRNTIMPMLGSAAAYGVAYSDDANTFANKLYTFGTYIDLYAASLANVSADASTAAKTMIDDAVEMMDTIAGIENVSVVKSTLEDIGGALKLYYGNLAGLETDGVEVDSETIKKAFTALADAAPDTALVQQISSFADNGSNNLSDFAVGITNLGTALESYGTDIGGLDKKQIGLANSVMSTVQTIQTKLSQVTWSDLLGTLTGKRKSIEDFGEDIAALGTALGKYGQSVENLDADDITNSKNALDIVSDLNEKLPVTGGIFTFFKGDKKLGEFASNMSTLGDGVQQFANKVAEGDFKNVSKAMSCVQSLGDVFTKLDKTGGAGAWFTGDKDLSVLSKGLKDVGADLTELQTLELDVNALDDIFAVFDRIANLQNSVDWETSNIFGFGQIAASLKSALTELLSLKYVDVKTGWGTETVFDALQTDWLDQLFGVIEQMNTALTGSTSIQDAFSTILTTNETAITESAPIFGNAIGTIIDEMSKTVQNDRGIVNAFNTLLGYSINAIRDGYALFVRNGEYLVAGIAEGIRNGAYEAINAAAQVVLDAAEAADKAGEVASPSKKFAELGMYLDLGLAQGLIQYSSVVSGSASEVTEGAIEGARYAMNSLSQMILDNMEDGPVIRPVLDLSEVQAGAAGMSGMFGTHTVGLRSSYIAGNIAQSRTASKTAVSKRASDTTDLGAAVESLNARIDELSNRISNMKVVTETGALIGQIESGMDRALGKRASRAKRGG